MFRFFALACALFLAGCVTCYHKADAPKGAFEEDFRDCEAKRKEAGVTGLKSGREFTENCMKEKGWQVERR